MTAMTEEWAMLWMQCLSQNLDYNEYCIHSDADHEQLQMAELEKKFPRIAEIYSDFGDERIWPKDGIQDADWRKWFTQHRHLFMSNVEEVTELNKYKLKQNSILLSIPLHVEIDKTVASVRDLLKSIYSLRSIAGVAAPKYQLNKRGGKVVVGYEQVRQAVITSTDEALDMMNFDGKKHTVHQAMIVYLQRNIDILGWTIDPRARKDLMEKGVLPEDRFENFKVRINRCRKDFKALSANTIRGVFPDLTEMESRSWDSFKGEAHTPKAK